MDKPRLGCIKIFNKNRIDLQNATTRLKDIREKVISDFKNFLFINGFNIMENLVMNYIL